MPYWLPKMDSHMTMPLTPSAQSGDQADRQPAGDGVQVDAHDHVEQGLEAGGLLSHHAEAVNAAGHDDEGNISVQPWLQSAGDLDLVDDDVPVQQNDNGGGDPHGEDQGVHGAPANTQLEHSGRTMTRMMGRTDFQKAGGSMSPNILLAPYSFSASVV